jgi:type I restriction enzyme, S subunit
MEVKPGYKQTEAGIIPEDWEVKKLGEIAEIATGNTPPTSDVSNYGSDFMFVSPVDLGRRKYVSHTEKYLSRKGFSTSRKFPKSAILFVCIGSTIGKCGIASEDLTSNQQINAIFPSVNISEEYFYYAVSACAVKIKSLAGEQAVPIVNKMQFSETKIPLPSLPEQIAIAEALADADALIESLELLIEKKRQVKQGAMQELLSGKRRLPGFVEGKGRYKQTEVGIIPEDWEVKKIGGVADVYRGASPRPIDNPIWFDEKSSVGWVRISDVTKSGMTLQETTQRLSELGIRYSRYVPRGSLIMSICATVGRPITTEIDVCIHDGFVVFENLRVFQAYFYYILKSLESSWSKSGQTGSQMNLNTGIINPTKILLPSLPEQIAIATVLSDLDQEITTLEAKLTKARHIKQGMMHNLLTGRIRLR